MLIRTLLVALCLVTPALAQTPGPQGGEGHNLASSDSGAPIWEPLAEDFLKTAK